MKRHSLISSASALAGLAAATDAPQNRPPPEDTIPTAPPPEPPKTSMAEPSPTRRRGRPPAHPDSHTARKPRAVYLSDGDMALLRRVAIVRQLSDGEKHGPSSVLASLIDAARSRLVAEIKRTLGEAGDSAR